MTRARRASLGMLVLVTGTALAACGGSGTESSTTPADESAATSAAASGADTFGIMVGAPTEFTLQPAAVTVRRGAITFTVTNGGKAVHEMVILKLTSPSLAAVTAADGSAKEDTSVGEVADIDPGVTKTATVQLPPGIYALICNEPGHFAGGMHQILTVL